MKSSELVARLRAQAQVYDLRLTIRPKRSADDDSAVAMEYGLNRWWNDQAAMFRAAADRIEALERALAQGQIPPHFDKLLDQYAPDQGEWKNPATAQAPLVVEPTPLSGSQPGMAHDTAASPLPLETP